MDADLVTQEHQPPAPVPSPDVVPEADDAEPLLLAALAAGGAVAAWTTGARSGAWSASLAVAVLAGSAWLERRRRPGRPGPAGVQLARAVLTLAAAAVAVGAHSGPAPLALAWLPAVCTVYALVLPPRAAAGTTLGALAVLAVLAAAAGSAGSRPPTAYAACALSVLAAALAAGTLRAVLDARRDGARPQPAAAAPPSAVPAPRHPEATVTVPQPSPQPSPVPSPAGQSPGGLPGTGALLEATARAQSRSGVVGGRVGLLVVALQGLDELPAAVGRTAAQTALDTLARRARAWLPAGDVVAWVDTPDKHGRLAVLLEGVDAQTCLVVGRRLAALLAEPVEAGPRMLTLPASVSVTLADDVREAPSALLQRALAAPALSPSDLLPAPGTGSPDAAADPLLDDLWPALGTGAVGVALQPIVALGTLPRHDRVVAVEALARWTRADGTGAEGGPQLVGQRVGGRLAVPVRRHRAGRGQQVGRRQRRGGQRPAQQGRRGLADVVREGDGHGRRQRQHPLPGLDGLGEQGGEAPADDEAGLRVDALQEHGEAPAAEPRDDIAGRQPGAGAARERVQDRLRRAPADGGGELVEPPQGDDQQPDPPADDPGPGLRACRGGDELF